MQVPEYLHPGIASQASRPPPHCFIVQTPVTLPMSMHAGFAVQASPTRPLQSVVWTLEQVGKKAFELQPRHRVHRRLLRLCEVRTPEGGGDEDQEVQFKTTVHRGTSLHFART